MIMSVTEFKKVPLSKLTKKDIDRGAYLDTSFGTYKIAYVNKRDWIVIVVYGRYDEWQRSFICTPDTLVTVVRRRKRR